MRPISSFSKYLFLVILFCGGAVTHAQDRCGTVEYEKLLIDHHHVLETHDQFEQWMLQKQLDRRRRSENGRTQATNLIPVVVHVIHNGEAVGSGKNISDAQILSQISVLNKDYQRLNSDAPNTPAEFVTIAAAFDVEFILAKQDPEGLATSGIVRKQGTRTSWTMSNNYELKSLSYWPAEDYLNIWVCNLTDFLGYSQFPVSGLPGLENSSTNRLTDGVVIAFNAFGSIDDGPFTLQNSYNKGRTATHEIGHFFGLNHIWGDDNDDCSGTDNVTDTPNQAGSTGGCPAHPRTTCGVTSMFQNYLDYTNDNCMNLFTQGQVSRMQTVIDNSPRRATLPDSPGLSDPTPVPNDLGVKEIITPSSGECTTSLVPTIEVRNYGSNAVVSARISMYKDGVITETKDFTFSPALALLESRTVNFGPISFSSGQHSVTYEILLTNGGADGHPSNNSMTQDVDVPQSISLPFLETFASLPTDWEIINPDQHITWELAPTGNGSNNSVEVNLFSYEDHIGEIDALITPVFDLTTAPAALLKFDVAYSQYESSNDGLKVIMLNNCNSDIENGIVVYSRFGDALATTEPTSSSFTPTTSAEWRTEIIDLSAYAGQGNFQLAFVSYNDWGNNLYLDNIGLTTSPIYDVVLEKIIAPSPVTCNNEPTPEILLRNSGTLISSLKVITTVNGVSHPQIISGLNFTGNTERSIVLDAIPLNDGLNEISVEVSEPDGELDFSPDDNKLETRTILNTATDEIPLRQSFDSSYEDQWTLINPGGGTNWEEVSISGNPALYVNAYDNSIIGDQSWLVSPTLDLNNAEAATLFYDRSYAFNSGTNDILYILASTDCGTSFTDTLYTSSGAVLAQGNLSESSWRPFSESDWERHSLPLNTLVGKTAVRIAFVFFNDQGNNLYIDNIELFLSYDPLRIDEIFTVYPNPVTNGTANVTFNLDRKGDVIVDIVDPLGKVVVSQTLPGILNQTFPFSLPRNATGVYILKVTTNDRVYYRRILLIR